MVPVDEGVFILSGVALSMLNDVGVGGTEPWLTCLGFAVLG